MTQLAGPVSQRDTWKALKQENIINPVLLLFNSGRLHPKRFLGAGSAESRFWSCPRDLLAHTHSPTVLADLSFQCFFIPSRQTLKLAEIVFRIFYSCNLFHILVPALQDLHIHTDSQIVLLPQLKALTACQGIIYQDASHYRTAHDRLS